MPETPSPSEADALLELVLADYLHAVEAGKAPDRNELLKQHPGLAADLGSFFGNRDAMERIAQPIKEQSPALAETIGASETPDTGVGTTLRYFGDYELLEEIARGGMGVVYRAKQISLKRDVALKMILAGQLASPQEIHRFHVEAEAAANLDHPNIVPIYEIGEHNGQHYFSMKLIPGGSLSGRVKDMVNDPKTSARILALVARAVHHAHQRGILHRDLKPSNILLDALSQPQVTDFGLAKRTTDNGATTQAMATGDRSDLTHVGVIVGTPSYMAPEQAAGSKDLTMAADIYSLGAILYEMLTGRPPFRAATALDTLRHVLEEKPEPPSRLNPKVDFDIQAICLKCLEKEPRHRYGSALALAEDLERWLAGKPIAARRISPLQKVGKWARRNPSLAILLVVLVCWYFNVRLQWAWLEWANLSVLLLLGLWRLQSLVRKTIGKPAGGSVVMETQDFMLPGYLLAIYVLCWYPATLVERKTLAFAAIIIPFCWGFVFTWLWRRRHAGPLAMIVRPLPATAIFFGACLGVNIVSSIYSLIHVAGEPGDALVNGCYWLQILSTYIALFLMVVAGLEIRKEGCVTFFRFVRWDEIESFGWTQRGGVLLLQLKLRKNPLFIQKAVPPAKKTLVDQMLLEHLPEATLATSAGSDALLLKEPQPAERVRDVSACLMLSAFFQFVGVLFCLIGMQSMATVGALILLVLAVVSSVVGVIVFAGAMKLRKLRNYRFARAACILAMLPTGSGVLFGLPAGVWALRVLTRPDVKEAFAATDKR